MKRNKRQLLESIVNKRAKLLESYAWERKPGSPLPTLEDTMARHASKLREQESPMENDIIGELTNVLNSWEDKEHPYYKDIANLVSKYTGA